MNFVADIHGGGGDEMYKRRYVAVLKLWVDPTIPGLREWYQEHIRQHNQHVENDSLPSSGFDVCIAHPMALPPGMATTHMAKLGIKAEMSTMDQNIPPVNLRNISRNPPEQSSSGFSLNPPDLVEGRMPSDHVRRYNTYTAYWLLPRSSLSKTPLMQSNHIGLIDMGYRGEIMAPLRNLSDSMYTLEPQTRLFQLCHPNAYPITVIMVDKVEELSTSERGEGGFGSTGI